MSKNKKLRECMLVNSGLKTIVDSLGHEIMENDFVRENLDPDVDAFGVKRCGLLILVWHKKPVLKGRSG